MTVNTEEERIATAIYTVNRHAKTAIDKKPLYQLKKLAIEKMLEENKAQKIGLHFVRNPRNSQQQSSVLIQCADYYFHMIPVKEDFKQLPHLGHLDETYRNPIRKMNLRMAKQVLADFIGPQSTVMKPPNQSTVYTQKFARPSNRKKQTMKSYLDL
ncbi:YkyB family protein [Bacillus sp. FJAT-22090]|uniref:YkyB family protein n=1 Tax=Bacillus sp. FJAT-22090 TaxID=1581038 RepID=UPI0011A3BE28|nr:YkyB family protein [Bacillus sp. FJAT-22090]